MCKLGSNPIRTHLKVSKVLLAQSMSEKSGALSSFLKNCDRRLHPNVLVNTLPVIEV